MEKCKFHNTNDRCQILKVSECDGSNTACSFFKTEHEYIAAFNHAISVNRAKGNCLNFKYQKNHCQYMEE